MRPNEIAQISGQRRRRGAGRRILIHAADRERVACVEDLRCLGENQAERRDAGKPLAVWVTLPATPDGLSEDGTNAVAGLLKGKVDIAGVNVMTMDYGDSLGNRNMLQGSEDALMQASTQANMLMNAPQSMATPSGET